MKRRRVLFRLALNIPVWALALLILLPVLWAIIGSFKSQGDIFSNPVEIWRGAWILKDYQTIFAQWPFARWYANSIIVCVSVMIGALVFSAAGGFAFAKYRFHGKNVLFTILVLSLAVPPVSIIIPLFAEIVKMHLANNLLALIVPFLAPAFGIFLMRQFISTLPDELIEAARVDGGGDVFIFRRVILPLCRPALGALAIVTFVFQWARFLWPLMVINSSSKFVLPLGLYAIFGASGTAGTAAQYGEMLAAATLIAVPPLAVFVALQHTFVAGLTMGAVEK